MKKHNIGHPCLLAFALCKEASRIAARLSKFDLLRFYRIIFVMNIRNLFIFYAPKLQMKRAMPNSLTHTTMIISWRAGASIHRPDFRSVFSRTNI